MKLTRQEVKLLNSKMGVHGLLKNKKINIPKVLEDVRYADRLRKEQEKLIKLQNWVIKENKKVVILFEGRDAAGKGGAIRRITEYLNPRHFEIVALDVPTSNERSQWFFQRYANQLPRPGKIVFFDRSWYNRAVVEPVNGFCTKKEYELFMSQVNSFESMLIKSDTYLIKLYFSISKREQAKRFKEIKKSPLKRWKMSPVDERAQELWNEYTSYKKKMFDLTDTKKAPWKKIDANKKSIARLKAIAHILDTIPY
jgi:polyphosphate kinase 2